MRTISLTKGLFAVVDDRDYAYLSQWKWYAVLNKGTKSYYATRASVKADNLGKRRTVFLMHKIITSTNKEQIVDHQDHDTLNNTRENLKVGTNLDNQKNQRLFKTNKSGYSGVDFHNKSKKWRAHIGILGHYTYLDSFDKKEDAIKCRKEAEIKYGYHKNHGIIFKG